MEKIKIVNIGLIGFGVVGQGVYKILKEKQELIIKRRGVEVNIKKIVVKNLNKIRDIEYNKSMITTDPDEVINDPEISIIVELVGGIETPYRLIEKSLNQKKHIVTANKALLALKSKELFTLANEMKVNICFEASVGGGIPIIRTINEALVGDHIKSLYGIINGTSNYILTKMIEENLDFKICLKKAQELGFAESDPKLDINGGDAAHKLSILASYAFNTDVYYDQVYCEGIENIELVDISYGRELGYTLKLLGIADEQNDNHIGVRVHPVFIPLESPLAGIKNEFNAILILSEYLGESMYSGKGAGMYPTANAVVGDIVDIAEDISYKVDFNKYRNVHHGHKEIAPQGDLEYQYYLRFNTLDEPGILAKIAGIFSQNNISIARVIQKGHHKESFVHLVLETHRAKESSINQALEDINRLPIVDSPSKVIRIVRPGQSGKV